MDVLNLAIASIDFLTLREKILLRKNIDMLEHLAIMSIEELSSIIGRAVRSEWKGKWIAALAERSLKIMDALGIACLVYGEKDYPPLLAETFDPPYVLFYRGNLAVLKGHCLSVVGTRRVCRESAEAAFEFARQACASGWTVVSGLADGIDSFAHRGAVSLLDEGKLGLAPTVAVLPCGIDTIVPGANKRLAASILKGGGCIVSEYAPGVPAEKWRFVQRNRIIAALCQGSLVVQAPPNSGALITADFALDYGRELVFHKSCFCPEAVRISEAAKKSLLSRGGGAFSAKAARTCESYVEDGACVVQNFEEFVKVLGADPGSHTIKKEQLELF